MLILTKEDIKKCITMQETIETCKSAMLSYSLKKQIYHSVQTFL